MAKKSVQEIISENPFVGLRAFEKNEDKYFFGRGKEVSDLIKKFNQSKFLAVIGSSGSGKSSLVKSGLLPVIYGGFLSSGSNWHVAEFKPGDDPIGNLSKKLADEGILYKNTKDEKTPLEPVINTTLRRSTNGLIEAYRQSKLNTAEEKLLIVVDQFEELFRYNKYNKQLHDGKSDAAHFINLLLSATETLQNEFPIYVIITMRSDFLGDCAEFTGLPEAINEGQYLIPRMTRDEMREAIKGPIAFAEAQISTRLVTRLLNEIGNDLDQLPVFQHAMMRTWNEWAKKEDKSIPIDFDDYEKIGRMNGALNQHADSIYDTLGDQQRICELMFKALTDKAADVRGIRRPKSVNDLCVLTGGTEKEIIELAEIFRKEGTTFLMPPQSKTLDSKSIIDISHESLMRLWKKLVKWTDEEVRQANIYKRLGVSAVNESKDPPEEGLWTDPQLAIGLDWRKKFRNKEVLKEWAKSFDIDFEQAIKFLKRSEDEDVKKKKEKARIAALIKWITLALFVVFAALTAYSLISRHKAVMAEKEAKIQKDSAKIAQLIALRSQIKAMKSETNARLQEKKAVEAYETARKSDSTTKESLKRTAEAEAIARASAKEERIAKEKANSLLRSIAASEYQRLIRDLKTDKASVYHDQLDYKLIAYDIHLTDSLGVQRKEDELYEKLYYCLKAGPQSQFAVTTAKKKELYSVTIGNNSIVFSIDNRLYLLKSVNGITTKDSMLFANNITAIAADSGSRKIFVATTDKDVTVLNYDLLLKPRKENTIVLGGIITAMDYFKENSNSVIFFGLKTGETGYINYSKKQGTKYQPVYRNDLEWEVSAIDFFFKPKEKRYYLFAANSKGKAVVYESGAKEETLQDFINPNIKLLEIGLPDNFGPIKSGKYDPARDRIIFRTTKDNYQWNPFTEQLVNELLGTLDTKRTSLQSVIDATKIY